MKKALAMVAAALVSACGGSSGSSDNSQNLPDPGEPNGSMETATAIAFGTPVVATVSTWTDYDFFKLTVPAPGATVRVQTSQDSGAACPATGTVDTIVEVLDATGASVWYADDSPDGSNLCEEFSLQLDEGTNYVVVSGWDPYPWAYRLEVKLP